MKIRVLSPAHQLPDWVKSGVQAYQKRLPRDIELSFIDISPVPRGKTDSIATIQAKETALFEAQLKKHPGFLVVLDEKGKSLSTEAFAKQLSHWKIEAPLVNIIIGGPDGVEPGLRAKADLLLSLSALTYPHPLVRVILTEQLYRAEMLLTGHPYHRA